LIPTLVPPEQNQQQPPVQHLLGQRLAAHHRGQLLGEPGEEVGVLEHVEQVDHTPATLDLGFERVQARRRGQLVHPRYRNPALPAPGGDPHSAGRALGQGGVERDQGCAEPGLEVGDKLRAVARHPDCRVVHVAVLLEIGGQVVVGIAPAVRPGHPDLAAAEGLAGL